ncbi:hypothetical protein V8F20_001892 [Naviculisporaceae sp. PSN 640]
MSGEHNYKQTTSPKVTYDSDRKFEYQPQEGIQTVVTEPQANRATSHAPLNSELVVPGQGLVTPHQPCKNLKTPRVRTGYSPSPASPVPTVTPPSAESSKAGRVPTSPRPFNPARYDLPPPAEQMDLYPPAALPDGEHSRTRKRIRAQEEEAARSCGKQPRLEADTWRPGRDSRPVADTYRPSRESDLVRSRGSIDAEWKEVEEARLEFNERNMALWCKWEQLKGLATKLDRAWYNFNLEKYAFQLEKKALEHEKQAFELRKEAFEVEKEALEDDKEALRYGRDAHDREEQAFRLQKKAFEHERKAFELQKEARNGG